MSLYFLLFIIMTCLWVLLFPHMDITFTNVSKTQKRVFCFIIAILLILFAGLRKTNIGADTSVYIKALLHYKSLPRNTILSAPLIYPFEFENGYFLLTKIAALYNFSPTAFLFLIAALIYIPLCIFLSRYCENPYLGILVYFAFGFFGYSLGLFRQMIAISITLMSFRFLYKRQFIAYMIIILIASMFHTSALIMFLFYFLSRLHLKRKHIILVIVLEIVFLLLGRQLTHLIVSILPSYAKYIGGSYDQSDGSYTMLFLYNFIFILSFYITHKDNKLLNISRNALLIAILLLSLSYSFTILGRAVLYYSIFLTLLIPMIISRTTVDNRLLFYILSILSLMFFFYYITKGSVIDPYQFFF